MRRAKGFAAIVLSIVLAFTLLPTTVLAAGEVCEIAGMQYTDLATALGSIPAGGSATIKLLTNINYTSNIIIDNKSVTFNLNGFTLDVTVNSGTALKVIHTGNVYLINGGAFNVTSTDTVMGVGVDLDSEYPEPACNVTVSNAKGLSGVKNYAGHVTVRGNIEGGVCGVLSQHGSTTTVGGNVTATGNNCYGVCSFNPTNSVTVAGNVTATGTGSIGVVASDSGEATIGGDITAANYIFSNGIYKTQGEKTIPTTKPGYFTYVTGNSTVWVKVPTYALTVVNGTGSGSYAAGDSISISAVVPVGKAFDHWTMSGGTLLSTTNAATTFTMPAAAVTVTANFVDATYALTMADGTDNTNTGPYTAGTVVSISVNSPPAGKVFKCWTSSGGGTFASATSATTTFTMPAAAVTVTATYVDVYATTVQNDGNGMGSANPTLATQGQTVALSDTPASHYHFKEWQVVSPAGLSIVNNSFTMPAEAVTVKAIFEADTYAVTVQNDGNGTGSANPTSAAQGQAVTLSNTPASHYHFREWQVISPSGLSIANNSFTMPAGAVTVKAIFEADTYAVTVQNNGNGTGSANPASAAQGQTVTLSNTPASHYHFKQWQVVSPSGLSIVNNSFTMPGEAVTVKAIFEADAPVTYTVNFINDGTTYTSKTVPVNTSIGSANWPAAPVKFGFTFGGWFTGLNGSGTQFMENTTVTASIPVFAKWTAIGGGLSGSGISAPPPPPPATATVTNRAGETISAPAMVTGQAVVNNQPINLGLLSNGQESTQPFTQSLSTSNKDRNVILTLNASPLGQPVEGVSTQYSAQQMEIGAGAASQLRANDITHIAFSVGNATATIPTVSLNNPALRNIATRAGGTLAEAAFRVELVPAQLTDAQKEALRGKDIVESFYLRVTMVVNGKQIDVAGKVSGIRAQIQTDVYSRNGRIGIFSGNRFTRLSATTSKNAAGEGLFNTAVNRSGLFIVTE